MFDVDIGTSSITHSMAGQVRLVEWTYARCAIPLFDADAHLGCHRSFRGVQALWKDTASSLTYFLSLLSVPHSPCRIPGSFALPDTMFIVLFQLRCFTHSLEALYRSWPVPVEKSALATL